MSLKGINAYKKGNLKQDVANADPHKLTLMLLQGVYGASKWFAYGFGQSQ